HSLLRDGASIIGHLDVDLIYLQLAPDRRPQHSFPTRRSSDLSPPHVTVRAAYLQIDLAYRKLPAAEHTEPALEQFGLGQGVEDRSEEHTSELQSRGHLVCRLLLEKKKQ